MKNKIPEIQILNLPPLFSTRRLAEYFDCKTADGAPASETIIEWWHSGKIPPPDCKVSKKAIYWKPETIYTFVESGGTL